MRARRFVPTLTAIFLAATLAAPALAVEEGPYAAEILVNGKPLREYFARGTTYVEAIEDAEYAVRLRNRTGRRVAVALAVDGLNSIDAKTTTARDASKWILGPHETITVTGWQTSSATARRFFFTTEDKSYGAWLGKTDNLGVISAAFFREVEPEPVPYSSREPRMQQDRQSAGPAPGKPTERKRADAGAAPESETLSDEHAATGIGREVDHRVRRVRFDAENDPASVVRIRYEYRDALVSLGVLPYWEPPLSRREKARGFEPGFAPDPYR